jgi:hypothetical protein
MDAKEGGGGGAVGRKNVGELRFESFNATLLFFKSKT